MSNKVVFNDNPDDFKTSIYGKHLEAYVPVLSDEEGRIYVRMIDS